MEKKDPNLLSVEDVREHCKLIRRSVETKEVHFFHVMDLFSNDHIISSYLNPYLKDFFRKGPIFILYSQARFMLRVLRALPVTRRKMNPIVLRSVMKTFYTADGDRDTKDSLLKFVAEVRFFDTIHQQPAYIELSQADELDGSLTPSRGKASATPLYPEVKYFF